MEEQKGAICAVDEKRFLLDDSLHSLAFGQHMITVRVRNEYAAAENGNLVIDAMEAKMDGISPEDREVFERVLAGLDLDTVPTSIPIELVEMKEPTEKSSPRQMTAPISQKKHKPDEPDNFQAGSLALKFTPATGLAQAQSSRKWYLPVFSQNALSLIFMFMFIFIHLLLFLMHTRKFPSLQTMREPQEIIAQAWTVSFGHISDLNWDTMAHETPAAARASDSGVRAVMIVIPSPLSSRVIDSVTRRQRTASPKLASPSS